MKVKDYIEYLQTLDPNKDIWVWYDMCAYLSPLPKGTVEGKDADESIGVKEGDYIIHAW